MSSRSWLAAFAAAATLCLSANAQIEDSGLQMVDPWGMGFLEAGEPALPASMWRASSTETLLPMMRAVRTQGLTPGERTLMRRMALSPATAPQGDQSPALLAERARILFELGEARPAANLMARLEISPPGLDSDEIATDLNLALGNEAMACAENTSALREGAYWAKLRAVCAALRDNTAGAELAIEMASSQGVNDSWLTSAVFAASGDLPNPPRPSRSHPKLALPRLTPPCRRAGQTSPLPWLPAPVSPQPRARKPLQSPPKRVSSMSPPGTRSSTHCSRIRNSSPGPKSKSPSQRPATSPCRMTAARTLSQMRYWTRPSTRPVSHAPAPCAGMACRRVRRPRAGTRQPQPDK